MKKIWRNALFFSICLLVVSCNGSEPKPIEEKGLWLFGLNVDTSSREEIEQAIEKMGGVLKMSRLIVDRYDSSKMLDGSYQLDLVFTKDNKFASASYYFSGDRMKKVRELVEAKYGSPTSTDSIFGMKVREYEWKLNKEYTIAVSRKWPQTMLIFAQEKRTDETLEYSQEIKKNEMIEAMKKQEKAF